MKLSKSGICGEGGKSEVSCTMKVCAVSTMLLSNLSLSPCQLGSITHLSFPTRSHLLSASEDGTLCLFRARDWAVLRSLHGHKGRVNSVAVHPSGKVALSVGKDKTLRMWDLMRGKGSASTKLGKGWSLISIRVQIGFNFLTCGHRG